MKLITLNAWGGMVHKPLLKFIDKHKDNIDFFLFQELFKSEKNIFTIHKYKANIYQEISEILSSYNSHFSPLFHNRDEDQVVDYPLSYGNAVFWKKNLKPNKKNEIFIYLKENEVRKFKDHKHPDKAVNLQYLEYENFVISNIHGFWNPAPKTDNDIRIMQSEKIIKFYKKYKLPFILGGDFNLQLDTKSVSLLEYSGLRNLIKESKVTTTRSSYYDLKWRKKDPIADYIFVSRDVKVYDFKVLKDNVSDHLPLYLEFEI